MSIGVRIKQIREQKGMSCSALAERVGLSAQSMWQWEQGMRGKTCERLPLIAKALGCSIDDLFPEMDAAPSPGDNPTADEESLDNWAI